jgi:hypothetical protein
VAVSNSAGIKSYSTSGRAVNFVTGALPISEVRVASTCPYARPVKLSEGVISLNIKHRLVVGTLWKV